MDYIPEDYKFSREHVWIEITDKKIYAGITNYFHQRLEEIDLIDIKKGTLFNKGEKCGIIYGKSQSEKIIMPVSGIILSINPAAIINPPAFNYYPYKNWLMEIGNVKGKEIDKLLTSNEYKELIKTLMVK